MAIPLPKEKYAETDAFAVLTDEFLPFAMYAVRRNAFCVCRDETSIKSSSCQSIAEFITIEYSFLFPLLLTLHLFFLHL